MRQAFPADPVLSAVDRLIDKCSAADVLDAKEIGCELAALRAEVVSLAKSMRVALAAAGARITDEENQ